MENVQFNSIDEVDDISTLDEYQVALDAGFTPQEALKAVARFSRDNARTPFQWNSGKNAGFSEVTPWLRVNPNYTTINLESQRNDPDSVYQYYRALIALRKTRSTRKPLFTELQLRFYRPPQPDGIHTLCGRPDTSGGGKLPEGTTDDQAGRAV